MTEGVCVHDPDGNVVEPLDSPPIAGALLRGFPEATR